MTNLVSFFVINTVFGLLGLIRFLFLIFYLKIMTDTTLYTKKCTKLLEESEIRFAGIVDKDGKLIAGGFKEGLVPYEGDETKLQSFFDFVSKASIRKEFDESLGPINYIAARRDKAVLVSFPFPITNILLLISAEPSVNIENLAKKVVEIFTDVK
jgi:hypothetical protein